MLIIIAGFLVLGTAALSLFQEIVFMGFPVPYVSAYAIAKSVYMSITTDAPAPGIPEALFVFTAVVIVAAACALVGCLAMLLRRSGTQNFALSAFLCLGLFVYANYQLMGNMPNLGSIKLNESDRIIFKELALWGAMYLVAAVISFFGNRARDRKEEIES